MNSECLLQWLKDPVGICEGLLLSIASLRRVIEKLNGEQGRWWLEDPLIVHKIDRLNVPDLPMIQIFHSLSGLDQVTDELSLMVPVIGDPSETDCALIFLAPELIHFTMEGLYLEDDRVLGDAVTDFERIWNPLRRTALELGKQDGTIW